MRGVKLQYLVYLPADRLDRIKGSHGLLEDHGDPASPDLRHFMLRSIGEIHAVVDDLAFRDK